MFTDLFRDQLQLIQGLLQESYPKHKEKLPRRFPPCKNNSFTNLFRNKRLATAKKQK
jgi:hypothetical protein